MNSPFRRGLCTGSSFQQMLRRRMREVSPFAQHSVSALALTCPHPLATSAPGATNHRASGRIRKRGGGAGGPGAAQGRGRVPTKTQGGAAAPDGRPPAAAIRGVQLPLAALHDGPLPQSQRLSAREVRASLPSGPPPRGRGPTCPSPALTSLPAFSRALPLRACAIGCPPAALQSASSSAGQSRSAVAPPDATRPRPLAQGLPTGESRLALPPLLQGLPIWLSALVGGVSAFVCVARARRRRRGGVLACPMIPGRPRSARFIFI